MADIVQHLPRGGTDIELAPGDAERLHQRMAFSWSARRWRSPASCRRGCWSAAARAGRTPGRHDQRMGEIEPAGDADDDPLGAGGTQPLHQAGDLDVVGLVAVLIEPRRIGRHERKAFDPALQAEVAGRRRPARRRCGGTRRHGAGGCRRSCPSAAAPAAADRGRRRRWRMAGRTGSVRCRPAWRRSRRSRPGRPRRDRWSICRYPPRHRGRRRGSAPTAKGIAAAASPPCRW